jgi:hypothetical protein
MKSKHLIRKYIKYINKNIGKLDYIDKGEPVYILFGEDEFEVDLKRKVLKLKDFDNFDLEDDLSIDIKKVSYMSLIMNKDGPTVSFFFDSNPYSSNSELKDSSGQIKALPFAYSKNLIK